MILSSRIPILLITVFGYFNLCIAAGLGKDRENSWSNGKCDENELFPDPPCCGISNISNTSGRIYGGTNVGLNEFPWMVRVCVGKSCGGGTLINSRWVLTAGHNVAELSFVDVYLGDWSPKRQKVRVDKIITHELYQIVGTAPEYDIALLLLPEPVKFTDYMKPICLPSNALEQQNFANKMATVAGWGMVESGSLSDVLLKASVKIWDSTSCQKYAKIAEVEICAGGVEGIDACGGDSGGPLMLQLENDLRSPYYQIGVVSYGDECGKSGVPGFYASVPAYMHWIKDKILSNQ